jgi:hypothetical protein
MPAGLTAWVCGFQSGGRKHDMALRGDPFRFEARPERHKPNRQGCTELTFAVIIAVCPGVAVYLSSISCATCHPSGTFDVSATSQRAISTPDTDFLAEILSFADPADRDGGGLGHRSGYSEKALGANGWREQDRETRARTAGAARVAIPNARRIADAEADRTLPPGSNAPSCTAPAAQG